jgi:hypothetical protein
MRRVRALALSLLLAGCASQPPSPSPTSQASAPPSEVPDTPTPSVAVRPSSSPVVPTPPATGDGQWTALDWAAPVSTRPFEVVNDVIAWRGGYVSAGQVQQAERGQAAAWASADWATWDRTLLDIPAAGESAIARVVAIGTGLVAIGTSGPEHCVPPSGEGMTCDPLPIAAWSSHDGRTWQREAPDPALDRASIVGVVGGPRGLIAVGGTGWNEPRIWISSDGVSWQAEGLPAETFLNAHLQAIAAVPDGWIVTGSTGGKEPECCVGREPETTPSAWFSVDGIRWQKAVVVGAEGAVGDQIGAAYVGSHGMVARGLQDTSHGWGSADGRVWTPLAPPPTEAVIPQTSDGQRIIGSSFEAGDRLAMWLSTDGTNWTPLAASGRADAMPGWSGDTGPAADAEFLFPEALGLTGNDGTPMMQMWLAKGRP